MARQTIGDLPARTVRAALTQQGTIVLAAAWGVSPTTVSRWRKRLQIPARQRPGWYPAPAQQRVLAALEPVGTWRTAPALQHLGYGPRRIYELLERLRAQGHVQRRGHWGHYEYALTEERGHA